MINHKKKILENICYTELVYGRINKKLGTSLSKGEIEKMVVSVISETDESEFQNIGKNIYVPNKSRNIRLTINSSSNRIITADKINRSLTSKTGST